MVGFRTHHFQALGRSRPLLPMTFGTPEMQMHDYKRHGATALFAALDMATGVMIGKIKQGRSPCV